MKNIVLISILLISSQILTAQSITLSPGAQSINGDSTTQDQLNVFGNGLLVGPKVKFTDEDPAASIHIMDCATTIFSYELAGTLKDPNSDSDYLSGFAHNCNFILYTPTPDFTAHQIDFELLDTEANGDTVFITNYNGSIVYASFSGNSLPTSVAVSNHYIRIRFKTNNNGIVGAGFVLKWRAILRDETPTPIQNYTGEGLVFDMPSNSLWSGAHEISDFENKGVYSTAMGSSTIANGDYSMATGSNTDAIGNYSTAMGSRTTASGTYSTALGYQTTAGGTNSTAMGDETTASGTNSTAMGDETTASGTNSTAMGDETIASGSSSTALGEETIADTTYATAMGYRSRALGYASTAMGRSSEADSTYATAMGKSTKARGYSSTAMGDGTEADSSYATAMGKSTIARGRSATAMGENTTASGDYSTSMGENTAANGNNSTAIGKDVAANGNGTLIIGDSNPGGVFYSSGSPNIFIGRFFNGYYLLTSDNLFLVLKILMLYLMIKKY